MSGFVQISRLILDHAIFALVCFAEYAIHYWMEPFRRGFFCSDDTLKYPLRSSTVSNLTVILVTTIVPIACILLAEPFRLLPPKSAGQGGGARSWSGRFLRHCAVCYMQIGYYVFGLLLTLIATELGKRTVGRLRPHFFAVCQPVLADGSTCAEPLNAGVYVEQYSCRSDVGDALSMSMGLGEADAAHTAAPIGVMLKHLREVSQSFPSGHASLSCYAMLYTALYVQALLRLRITKLLKHLLQFALLLFAWYTALTRISDYHHHATDVLAGAVLGCLMALLVSIFVGGLQLFDGQRRFAYFAGVPALCNGNAANSAEMLKLAAKAASASATASANALPSYTFGSVPYLHAVAATNQYGQPYQNYAYVQ